MVHLESPRLNLGACCKTLLDVVLIGLTAEKFNKFINKIIFCLIFTQNFV